MRFTKPLAAALLSGLLATPALAQAPLAGAGGDPDEPQSLNVDGALLGQLIDLVARKTGKVFLFQERVKQVKVYTKGTRKFPKSAIFDVFQSILELNGFALATIAKGTPAEVVKVVDARNMRRYRSETFDGTKVKNGEQTLPEAEEVVTIIYGLEWASAREVSNALRPLLDPNVGGQIIGIDKVESLVITDYAPNVKRLIDVIQLMDQPGPQLKWEVIPLQWADPDDLVGKIGQFMQGQTQQQGAGPNQPRVQLVSYPRTQSIIVQAIDDHLKQVKDLIAKLDVRLSVEPTRIHIRKLKHTQADEMADTVNQILTATPTLADAGAGTGPASPPANPRRPRSPQSPGRNQPRQQPRPQRQGGLSGTEDQATAIADVTTNSLIVVASENEWREIDRIITALDVRRPQVLIEAAIIEVTSSATQNIGAELATIDNAADGSTRGFAATSFGLSNLVDANGTPVTATSPGVPSGRIPNLGTQGFVIGLTRNTSFQIPILLNLIATDSNTNVLSLPRILTNDNEEGHVKVGESVPTAQLQNVGAAGQLPTRSFQGFEEASLDLTVTPHISEGNYLNLELALTIEQFTGSSPDPSLPPPKATRELTTRITVPNHQTVVIGGLSSSRLLESTNKIPILGDIPLIGMLFQRRDVRETRTHLFIFLTPHILDDQDFRDLGKLSRAELAAVRATGIDPGKIDAGYRSAFRDQEWPGADVGMPAGTFQYRSMHE